MVVFQQQGIYLQVSLIRRLHKNQHIQLQGDNTCYQFTSTSNCNVHRTLAYDNNRDKDRTHIVSPMPITKKQIAIARYIVRHDNYAQIKLANHKK